jgi:hypothetical protein
MRVSQIIEKKITERLTIRKRIPIIPLTQGLIHVLWGLQEESVICIIVLARITTRTLTSLLPSHLLIFDFLDCLTSNASEKKIKLKEVRVVLCKFTVFSSSDVLQQT